MFVKAQGIHPSWFSNNTVIPTQQCRPTSASNGIFVKAQGVHPSWITNNIVIPTQQCRPTWTSNGIFVKAQQTCPSWISNNIVTVGQNRMYTPYMTVYLVISLPNVPYIHCIYIFLANPKHSHTDPAMPPNLSQKRNIRNPRRNAWEHSLHHSPWSMCVSWTCWWPQNQGH